MAKAIWVILRFARAVREHALKLRLDETLRVSCNSSPIAWGHQTPFSAWPSKDHEGTRILKHLQILSEQKVMYLQLLSEVHSIPLLIIVSLVFAHSLTLLAFPISSSFRDHAVIWDFGGFAIFLLQLIRCFLLLSNKFIYLRFLGMGWRLWVMLLV